MDGLRGPEQSAPPPTPPTADQIRDQALTAAKDIRNEPTTPNFPNLGSVIENQPTAPPAPTLNQYGEIQSPNNSTPAQEIHTTVIPELADKPTNPEQDLRNNLDAIKELSAMAEGLAGAGDFKTAKKITDGLLDGTLKKGLDNPPSLDEIRMALSPNNWRNMNLAQRVAVVLLKK